MIWLSQIIMGILVNNAARLTKIPSTLQPAAQAR